MAHYRTFIADPFGSLSSMRFDVQSKLARYFSPCTADDFENNWVYFVTSANGPLPQGHELLVYFMPNGISVVKNVPNAPAVDLTANGNTVYTAGASEVYVGGQDADGLAKLAFHELMHNRLKLNNGLHSMGGLASADITNEDLSDQNIEAMKKVISRPIRQWTAGVALLFNGINDPISEYYSP